MFSVSLDQQRLLRSRSIGVGEGHPVLRVFTRSIPFHFEQSAAHDLFFLQSSRDRPPFGDSCSQKQGAEAGKKSQRRYLGFGNEMPFVDVNDPQQSDAGTKPP